MSCRRFIEDDFNNGHLPEEIAEFLPPDMRGEHGEDDPADHCDPEDRDEAWLRHGIAVASDPDTFRNHQRLLRTGGRLNDSAINRHDP